ncbi:thiolase family protein [Blastococcus brunescens]|uniref:Probable acetyl-CoA acetyltransferase n=1 Tax=Blastococcus brunescens TaxID=1564165 RepID=A0ABZ1B3Q6_9ACTN|nr:thiolase family protein [Blastococcus sp. BMG 8361]WRL65437.1 thiolase family protein [Blastococcus sp. BMG 8361]
MSNGEQIVLVDGARTPIGSFGGALKDVPAHELGGAAARAALARSGIAPDEVDEVVMGCIGQIGADAFNARRVARAAGLPVSVPAYTVNRLCGSGLQAIWSAAMQMRWGGVDVALAGGDESMSRMPFYDFNGRSGWKLGDRKLADGTVMMLTDPFDGVHMGVTAENVAAKYQVSRQEQDEFALESQRKAASVNSRAAFVEEMIPVEGGSTRSPRTSTLGRTRRRTSLPVCGRCSGRTGPSRPVTRRASMTAREPWCSPGRRLPGSAGSPAWRPWRP